MSLAHWFGSVFSDGSGIHPREWRLVPRVDKVPRDVWTGPGANKLLGGKLPSSFDPNSTTVLGGICCLFTGDAEAIRTGNVRFQSVDDFAQWLASWYPRMDQVHDTVGIPPSSVRNVIYVCEDSFFARRVAAWTKLPESELTQAFKQVHQRQGAPAVERWLKQCRYRGRVTTVYTSDLERELECALRIMERLSGVTFGSKARDGAKVVLMYTGLWVDVLGVTGAAVIAEPANHMTFDIPGLNGEMGPLYSWFHANEYGGAGVNKNLGVAGYVPFWSSGGVTRNRPHTTVPTYGSHASFVIPDTEVEAYCANMLFPNRGVHERGPGILDAQEVRRRIGYDLAVVYGPTV